MQDGLTFSPKYVQLSELVRRQIAEGHFKPEEQLPTEETLCRDYRVSRGTVQKALELLENEGLLRREAGRGTFVNSPRPALRSFWLGDLEPAEPLARHLTTRTLSVETLAASGEVQQRLQITEGEPVLRVAQLRLAHGQPVAYEERHLALALCPSLAEEDLQTQPMHWLLVHKYQVALLRVSLDVELRDLSDEQAALLQVAPGRQAFFVDRLTYTVGSRPAVWYQALLLDNHYEFRADFQAML